MLTGDIEFPILKLYYDEEMFWFADNTGAKVGEFYYSSELYNRDPVDGGLRTYYVVYANQELSNIPGTLYDFSSDLIGRTFQCKGCWVRIDSYDSITCYFEPNYYSTNYFCLNWPYHSTLNADEMVFEII